MAVVPVPGSLMVQKDLPHGNVVYSDQEGVLYNPNPTIEGEQDGFFYYTCAPSISSNFAWNILKLNWTRNYTSTPTIFEALFTLEGVLLDGTVDLLVEKPVTSLTASAVTEDVIFDLRSSRSAPSFVKSDIGAAASGKVQLNIPKRWLYFDSITLNRAWLDDYTKRKTLPVVAGSTYLPGIAAGPFDITYDSDMKADFSDIRFVSDDGRTIRCYWRESYTASNTARFYFYYPRTNEARNVYIYYGDSAATYIGSPISFFTFFDDFADSSIRADWTQSKPVGTITESGENITVAVASGVNAAWRLGGSTSEYAPIFHTPLETEDWVYVAKTTFTGTSGGHCYAGIMLYKDRSNALRIGRMINGAGNALHADKIVGGSSSDIGSYAVTTNTLWYKIQYVSGVYFVSYSTDGKTFTPLFDTTTALGFTPTDIGFFAQNWSTTDALSLAVDYIFSRPYMATLPAPGTLGSEESTITVNPDTPSEDDHSILYTLPADWSAKNPAYLGSTELHHSLYNTNDIAISAQDILELSPNAVDVYQAMRIGVNLKADKDCNVRFNSLSYEYEVI